MVPIIPAINASDIDTRNQEDEEEFLTEFDREVLGSLITFHNRPIELLKIASPALISLVLCPITLYMYIPLVNSFWPPDKFNAMPNINEAIACFLAPAGLVYATSFGFAFQSALSKQSEILYQMTYKLGLVDQIITLSSKITFSSLQNVMDIYKATKTEAIFMILQVENRQPSSFKSKPPEDIKGV